MVQILGVMDAQFETVNILEDERLRSGMKEYSQVRGGCWGRGGRAPAQRYERVLPGVGRGLWGVWREDERHAPAQH